MQVYFPTRMNHIAEKNHVRACEDLLALCELFCKDELTGLGVMCAR